MANIKPKPSSEIGYVKPRDITDEMKESYIDYAMSVIVSRALPDVRDGLKPVHRRILYAMNEMGLAHASKFRKSAAVVGDVLGKYHPHGDQAVYDSLVRMAQDFSLRYPLIEGQGNFGCFTKDTKVSLIDGRAISFGELVKEHSAGKIHWTFSFNHMTRKIEIAEVQNPRMTRRNAELLRVELDNGEMVRCTPDHRFLLRDGTYVRARDLTPGGSLMAMSAVLNGENKKPAFRADSLEIACNTSVLGSSPTTIIANHTMLSSPWNKKPWTARELHPSVSRRQPENRHYTPPMADSAYHRVDYNHKVVSITMLQTREDVYDITVNPWHNFALASGVFVHNSIDGDPAAAMRYSEARLSSIGEEMLRDISKDTVDLGDNYDGTRKEPIVLPSPLPQLFLNGSLGIAVGMATNIPPHNLSEAADALAYLIDHPKADTEDLFKFIKGPDFPTGGLVYNQQEIIEAYSQGKGPILSRGKADVVEGEKGSRTQIIITEIPYQVLKSTLIEQFARLVQEKKIEGIKDIRDESDKEGMRIVIELQRDAYPQKILNRLYKFTDLQKTFHLNMIALVDGIQPRLLSLPEIFSYYLEHRKNVVVRRTQYDLEKAKERAHILEGLHKCLAKIDAVIKTIKTSANREDAQRNLMRRFKLTQIQANAILETKLSALARLERQKIEQELKDILSKIKELSSILKSPEKVKDVMKKEFLELKAKFGDARKTRVQVQKVGEIAEEDLIPQEETLVTLTRGGYIKRISPSIYKMQKRGGKGMVGMKTVGDDIIEHFLSAMTHDSLLFFTDSGKVFRCQAYEIPEGARVAKGRGLLNFLELSPQDKVLSLISLSKEDAAGGAKYITMVTKNGIIKKTSLEEFENIRRSGLIAITLKKGDLLRYVAKTTGQDEVMLVTKKGQSIRFSEKNIRPMGRPASGVAGIRLKRGDEVVGMDVIKLKIKNEKLKINEYLLVVTENGYGKRTDLKEYRLQGRGGSGIKTAQATSKTGDIVASRILAEEEEDLIVISRKGNVIRTKIGAIAKLSRATQGVRIMRLEEGDKVASAACI